MFCQYCGNLLSPNQGSCPRCGAPAPQQQSPNAFCPVCGHPVNPGDVICNGCGTPIHASAQPQAPTPPSNVKKRDVAVAIILSFVTCGIYMIYWFVKLTNEINLLSGQTNDTSGGTAFLLSLVTCGIYEYYWAYKIGEKCDRIKGSNDSKIIFLILMFCLPIVIYALAQDTVNKAISRP